MSTFCIECKHSSNGCNNTMICKLSPTKQDMVTGEKYYNACVEARKDGQPCGPEAKLFEEPSMIGHVIVVAVILVFLWLVTH